MIKINNQLEVLKRLNLFSQCFGRITTIEELATNVTDVLDDLLYIEASELYFYDCQEKRLRLLVTKGLTESERANAEKTSMERNPGHVFKTGQVLNIPDVENDSSYLTISYRSGFKVHSEFYSPVLNGKKPMGVLGIVSSSKDHFNEEYQVVLSLICNIAGELFASMVNKAEQKKVNEHQPATEKPYKETTLFDLSKLSKLLGDDTAEIIDLVGKFIELTPEYSAALFAACEQNNLEEVAKSAHKIKSSLELLASGNLRSNIRLINEYARKRENLEKLPLLTTVRTN